MKYASGGDLHSYLKNYFHDITWNRKLYILYQISIGLEIIHNADFVHRDLHSANVLFVKSNYSKNQWQIGDLGLLKPANDILPEDTIYGVMPYIAPEIFRKFKYSKASDIYSMGMIMWEFTTGCRAFDYVEHNSKLILDIINGLRPGITEDTPELFADLMENCWEPNPLKRPSITEICKTLSHWHSEKIYSEIFNRAEIRRHELMNLKKLGPEYAEKPHSEAIYTSRSFSLLRVDRTLNYSNLSI
ncbi:1764_t:CDS:2 [Funneliformis geosporum]|nr:1764_t:CDS:2 [Funneliformis geosporum]